MILDTGGCGLGDGEVFLERLGIADNLELSTNLGSPAWPIATGESLAAQEAPAHAPHAAPWAAIVQNVLGSPVRVQVIATGEPDWGDPWARSRLPAPRSGGAA